MTALRSQLLGMKMEYASKSQAATALIMTQAHRVAEIECDTLLAWEDAINLDWLRRRYGDYARQAKVYKEKPEYTTAKLTVIKRVANQIKEDNE